MSHVEFEERIPACKVTKDLVQSIEQYLLREAPKDLGLPEEHVRESYSLVITDKSSVERLSGIAEYQPSLFLDTTTVIELRVMGSLPFMDHRVSVTFDKDYPRGCKMVIEVRGDRARASALAVRDSIIRLIEPCRTTNWLYHIDHNIVAPFMVLVGAVVGGLSAYWLIHHQVLYAVYAALGMVGLLVSWNVLPHLRPYVEFDTNAHRRNSGLMEWMIRVVVAFSLTGIILPWFGHAITRLVSAHP